MAIRNNKIDIPEGPDATSVFQTKDAGGDDGSVGTTSILLSCHKDSERPLEYRKESPADPDDEWAELQPGEAVKLNGSRQPIKHVVMRGVDGDAIGGVEVLD